ncbi:MAG: DUF2975 domain-containing protein [Oscillospiraceae bacterium]|nr:DUF2975 domain-containing protein [Oscillospiraceae bacterium]
MFWNDRRSLELSRWCVRGFCLVLAAVDVGCYPLVKWYMSMNRQTMGQGLWDGLLMMGSIWLISVPAWAALYRLGQLLKNIAAGQVFTPENVRALRIISWCFVTAGALCFVSAFHYLPWGIFAAACGFMALLMRVVKNCFEQAVLMKDELDFTV